MVSISDKFSSNYAPINYLNYKMDQNTIFRTKILSNFIDKQIGEEEITFNEKHFKKV